MRRRPSIALDDDDRLYTTGDLRNALEFVAPLVAQLRTARDQLSSLNLGGDIEWGLREKLRAMQGTVDQAINAGFMFLEGVATDDAWEELRELDPEVYADEPADQ